MTNNQTGLPSSTSSQSSREFTKKKTTSKSLLRCVSMGLSDNETIDAIKKASIGSKSPSRKRPRSDTIQKIVPESTTSVNNGPGLCTEINDLNSIPRISEHRSNNRANIASIRKKNRKKECIPLNFNARALSDADPNIAYTPYIPTPSSPQRSVVSCDFDAGYPSNMICEEVLENSSLSEVKPKIEKIVDDENAMQLQRDMELEREQEQILSDGTANLPQDLLVHIKSLRIEANLFPMKQLLYRLLTHQTYNRKGWFNVPVDAVALGLKDYNIVVKRPMDLGTIKKSLLSNVYHNQVEVARDICLVFRNACLYNPPKHPVHEAAKHLLEYFEDAYSTILSKNATSKLSKTPESIAAGPYSLPPIRHTCKSCLGRECQLCKKGCLSLEPSLLICAGSSCSGTKIRRGIYYYCALDGSKTWCQKCYPSLPSIIPSDDGDDRGRGVMYKRDLLKRKNEEDIVERWIDCTKCGAGVHEMCAFVNEFCTDREKYVCPICVDSVLPEQVLMTKTSGTQKPVYSFLSGSNLPERIQNLTGGTSFDARQLPGCNISNFIEQKVKERLLALDCPKGAEETVTVKVISDCQKEFSVPPAVLQHFRMQNQQAASTNGCSGVESFHEPPSSVEYRSKAIALFQRIDGMDVCIFCMYVQEYDTPDEDLNEFRQKKRVYLAYIDSVEHFRPRRLRTDVYHEMLTAYFASARARGFENIHIWSCPPSRGNSFVFWGHPHTQRTPTKEHLLSWYHNSLSHAVDKGVITDVKSLYEDSFQQFDKSSTSMNGPNSGYIHGSTMICPPLLEGDFWIEEAVRIHSTSISKWSKTKKTTDENDLEKDCVFNPTDFFSEESTRCPVMHVAMMIENSIMNHTKAAPFLRPVNAAALKLKDYHVIIKKPMDLGTALGQCLLGEYETFQEIVTDLELTFANAMRYNPKGHVIHTMARDLLDFVREQLAILVKYWRDCGVQGERKNGSSEGTCTLEEFYNLSMRLSTVIKPPSQSSPAKFVEDSNGQDDKKTIDRTASLLQGPEGIARLMVGEDVWLLDKRHAHRDSLKKKKKSGKQKELTMEQSNSDSSKRCESWLSDEVLTTVRKLRAGIFVCQLKPKTRMTSVERVKEEEYLQYIKGFDLKFNPASTSSVVQHQIDPSVSETRHGLLEFSQYRNLQFDSVRRAKYSTAMILFYLQHPGSPGIIPTCSSCSKDIVSTRFQKINKSFDERRRSSQSINIRLTCVDMSRNDHCEECFNKMDTKKRHDYVPVRVSFRRTH